VKLLLDEMFPALVAHELRDRGHDVVSVHDPEYQHLEGAPDVDVFAAALADGRAILTENVPDFVRLEADALSRGARRAGLIFTTNRHRPRGQAATIGRLVVALNAAIAEPAQSSASFFLEPAGLPKWS
jgi:predicted nuclease of predicted toxin-antitoxin system